MQSNAVQPMAMYQIPIPQGVVAGQAFQANVGGQVMQLQCPQGLQGGQIMQVPGPPAQIVVVQAPVMQVMNNDADGGLARVMGPLNGMLIRQKLDIWEAFVSFYAKENKYKVAAKPDNFKDIPYSQMTDDLFKEALKKHHVMTMKEKSECCQRILCLNKREFEMKIKPGKATKGQNWDEKHMLSFFRPFKCTIRGPCWICCAQEITAKNNLNQEIGRVQEVWKFPGSCCCKRFWHLTDKTGEVKYVMVDDLCSKCNFCAPTCLFPVRSFDLMDPTLTTQVGGLSNIFPGCNSLKGCLGEADNYIIDFPSDASPEDKATILAAAILIDYQLFEKSDNDDSGGNASVSF